MTKLLTFSFTILFSVLFFQSCSDEDNKQDEFLKEYNLPKGVTKPTLGYQYLAHEYFLHDIA